MEWSAPFSPAPLDWTARPACERHRYGDRFGREAAESRTEAAKVGEEGRAGSGKATRIPGTQPGSRRLALDL